MIGRFRVQLPFKFVVPENAVFPSVQTTVDTYDVFLYGPIQTKKDVSALRSALEHIAVLQSDIKTEDKPRLLNDFSIDGRNAFYADVIQLDFQKPDFDRTRDAALGMDPPLKLAFGIINSFLRRVRAITGAPYVHEISDRDTLWTVTYLSDTGEELPANTGLTSTRTSTPWTFDEQSITEDIWTAANALPFEYEPPRWGVLLLDARSLLPQIGPALVLAATAIETAASATIDYLLSKSTVPKLLQEWIKDRDDIEKRPSVEEQCDAVLKSLTGRTLKEDLKLWQDFKSLKTTRNKFVHQGVLLIEGKPAKAQDAARLIDRADAILSFLEQFLDDSQKTPGRLKPVIKLPPILDR